MRNRRWNSNKRRKEIYARRGTQGGNNMVASQYPSRRAWRKMEDDGVMLLENFLQKCSMGYTLYPWISLLEPTLETSYKPQT